MKRLLFLLLVLAWPVSGWAQVTNIDRSAKQSVTSGSSLTFAYTVPTGNNMLVVSAGQRDSTHITGVTYDGVALVKAAGSGGIPNLDFEAQVYCLKAPTTNSGARKCACLIRSSKIGWILQVFRHIRLMVPIISPAVNTVARQSARVNSSRHDLGGVL